MIPVFFNPESVVYSSSFTPTGYKSKLVTDIWTKKYKAEVKIVRHEPLSQIQLWRAHHADYVKDVLTGKTLNGAGTIDPHVCAASLHTCGGVLAAAQYVTSMWPVKDKVYPVAVAPYSGFHHAGWDRNENACTFNGLAVAALEMIEGGYVDSCLILDCDYRYGNGTQDILDRATSDYTGFVKHWSAGELYGQKLDAKPFLDELPKVLKRNKKVGLVIYQAGMDSHVGDLTGGFLTYSQLQERDRIVFETCGDLGLPIVWTLGAGYQHPVKKTLRLHEGTLLQSFMALGV